MKRDYRIGVAREVIEEMNRGYYEVNEKRISFKSNIVDVKFYKEYTAIGKIRDKAYGNIVISNLDSFKASKKYAINSRTAVLNFASARHPGGGFEAGSAAQEESLCRASTLYKSLSSDEAKIFYKMQQTGDLGLYHSHILVSPNVVVYKDELGRNFEDNYTVGVITAAAVNVGYARSRCNSADAIKQEMLKRAREVIKVAIDEGYKSIILGAWGCGVFGNSPWDIAEMFRTVLVEEGYRWAFDNIEFAVYDTTKQTENYRAFVDTFKNI